MLAVALLFVTVMQLRTANDRTTAEQSRMTSFRLADQMRQTSNDLTRMVRLYVSTGKPKYREYYDQILAIRAGKARRPLNYDSSFWDRVLNRGPNGIATGPPASLNALMRRAHFSTEEFKALGASLAASNALAITEKQVMNRVAPRIEQGVDADYPKDVAAEYKRLVDDQYHLMKDRIMEAIERFTTVVDRRTGARADALQARTNRLLVAQGSLLALLVLAFAFVLAYSARAVVRPLGRLTAVARRIRGGDWSQRATPAEGVRELRELAGDFDEMADAVQRDLAGRMRAEQEARDAQGRLRNIADRVPGAVFQFHVDPDGAVSVRFASRDASIHGTDAEVEFPAVARAVLAADRGAWLDSIVAAARSGGSWEHEYRIMGPGGALKWMRAQAVARTGDDGSGDLYGYVSDITDQKALQADLLRAREEAESADRAKSAFLAMVSHELRTPLVAVTGTLEVLALDELEDRQRELVDVALRSASTLLAVIGDVLDFSKIESGHLDLDPRPVAVGRLVEELSAQYRHTAAAKGVRLRARVDPALAPVHAADADRLRQVLGNLVSNAIKYTPGGEVDLRVVVAGEGTAPEVGTAGRVAEGGAPADAAEPTATRPAAQRVTFEVQDTGIGIAPEDQERLFVPFAQAHARTDGTGLGLVIARQLAEAMGGTLTMDSAVGAGTTMRLALSLPVSTVDAQAVLAGRPGGTTARRRLPTRAEAVQDRSLVLLVEDHPVNRAVLRRQLETIGFVTDVAADAGEALERLRSERYGLVLSDVQLPDRDGYALVREWRAEERAIPGRERVPIVALTASAVHGEEERCRASGMDDLVTKPAPMAVLAGTLRRWLPHVAWAEAVTAGPPGTGGFDLDVLREVTEGDVELEELLLRTYAESMREDLAAAERALEDADRDGLRRVAHQVVGASRTVGARRVADAALRLQRALDDGDPDPVELERLVESLRQATGAVVAVA
ncbi:ATP-binding protein [Patulibacter sp. NPDC049589]|uniref:hybrid sensor histidine kinase/response regulator n=1 Tax=Patulibacter sp. NPDC049589 TaxID=3154731 RepID=UPI003429B997